LLLNLFHEVKQRRVITSTANLVNYNNYYFCFSFVSVDMHYSLLSQLFPEDELDSKHNLKPMSVEKKFTDSRVNKLPSIAPKTAEVSGQPTSVVRNSLDTHKSASPSLEKRRSFCQTFSAEEVARHNTQNDCWIILNGKVYDITNFFNMHPGGKRALLNFAGKDASANIEFHSPLMMKQAKAFYIGDLEGYKEPSSCVIS